MKKKQEPTFLAVITALRRSFLPLPKKADLIKHYLKNSFLLWRRHGKAEGGLRRPNGGFMAMGLLQGYYDAEDKDAKAAHYDSVHDVGEASGRNTRPSCAGSCCRVRRMSLSAPALIMWAASPALFQKS
jgi:hypothetical protein